MISDRQKNSSASVEEADDNGAKKYSNTKMMEGNAPQSGDENLVALVPPELKTARQVAYDSKGVPC